MKKLAFVQVQKEKDNHVALFRAMMRRYTAELDAHRNRHTREELLSQFTNGLLFMLGPHDRHLEFAYLDGTAVGFLYGKIDHVGHKGFIKPEYGYIMEFYVEPSYRRQGYGTQMARRIERLFAGHGAERMYLTADPVTGRPFWEAMGFRPTGEISPENRLPIYEKTVDNARYTIFPAAPAQAAAVYAIYAVSREALHGREIFLNEWKKLLAGDDPDERNFLISQGERPIAWLRINGLCGGEHPWLSMLAVSDSARRRGVGSIAVRYAESYVWDKGFRRLGIHTTADNLPAQHLYLKCGYTLTERGECTTGDGVVRAGLTFVKQLD